MPGEKILVLGASGYIGSRLIPVLLDNGFRVRAAGRSAARLKAFAWSGAPGVELADADALDKEKLAAACRGCSAAYYLVHSMNPQSGDFERADRAAALNMAGAAGEEGLRRVIYLGGLGAGEKDLSKHLRSRHEVSDILHAGPVPATSLRAAMIIGGGSASFGILRSLVDRLPVMITPRWVGTEVQPIGERNALQYLAGCLSAPDTINGRFDIGGPDIVTYRELMDIYCEEAGKRKRFIIPVPVLTPRLSSLWIGLVTPYPAHIARPLAEGLKNRVVCGDDRITRLIPQRLLTCREAIREAIKVDVSI